MPRVARVAGGQRMIRGVRPGDPEPTREDAAFCLGFAIESAPVLAEFDRPTTHQGSRSDN